jgi:hypothetical protein
MEMIEWARYFRFERCVARKEPNVTGFWGRCERRRMHKGDHMLKRKRIIVCWSTEWTRWINSYGEITVEEI